MAHKKGVGSSRNGRDSAGKRLGLKKFAGEYVRGSAIEDLAELIHEACVAASDRFNSEHHATLFSHFLNELLELVFRLHAPSREIFVHVFKTGDELLIELRIPIDTETERAYQQLFGTLGEGDTREFLRKHIQKIPGRGPQRETAFLELAGIYHMKLDLQSAASERTLVLSMPVNFD